MFVTFIYLFVRVTCVDYLARRFFASLVFGTRDVRSRVVCRSTVENTKQKEREKSIIKRRTTLSF